MIDLRCSLYPQVAQDHSHKTAQINGRALIYQNNYCASTSTALRFYLLGRTVHPARASSERSLLIISFEPLSRQSRYKCTETCSTRDVKLVSKLGTEAPGAGAVMESEKERVVFGLFYGLKIRNSSFARCRYIMIYPISVI